MVLAEIGKIVRGVLAFGDIARSISDTPASGKVLSQGKPIPSGFNDIRTPLSQDRRFRTPSNGRH
jgi:hypothetical protein